VQPVEAGDASAASHDDGLCSPGEVNYGNGGARIRTIAFWDESGRNVNVMACGQAYELRYMVEFLRDVSSVGFGMSITTTDGIPVAGDFSTWHLPPVTDVAAGAGVEVRFRLRMNLAPGTYFLNAGVASLEDADMEFLHRRVDVIAFRVVDPSGRAGAGLAYLSPECSVVEVLLSEGIGGRP
jgi:lipopolysaccharide transport system ATP-binding protein